MKWLLRTFAVLLICVGMAADPGEADQPNKRHEVHELLKKFQELYGFPGATVAFVRDDGVVEKLAVGLADIEAGKPMTPDSRMLAASIGKTIWGALVVALEAEGTLKRSDLVSTYLGHLPWFAQVPNAHEMTIGQLLTHSAGLPDHVHMDGAAEALIRIGNEDELDPVELITLIFDEPPLFEPGSAWSYTDTGYILLGLALEAATDSEVFELAEAYFLKPLGLTATSSSDLTKIEDMAVGYTIEANPFGLAPRTMDDSGRLTWNPAVEWTGGGFVSTSADLARWGRALFTGAAIDAHYLHGILDGVPIGPDAPGTFYGSGVAIYEETSHGRVYGHGGWIPGYVSSLRHYADHGLTVAFQINTDAGVVDGSTNLVSDLEAALAEVLVYSVDE